jgi:hypothetical protein
VKAGWGTKKREAANLPIEGANNLDRSFIWLKHSSTAPQAALAGAWYSARWYSGGVRVYWNRYKNHQVGRR